MRNLIIETSPMKGNSDRRLGSAEAVPQNILTLTHTQLTLTQNPIKKDGNKRNSKMSQREGQTVRRTDGSTDRPTDRHSKV